MGLKCGPPQERGLGRSPHLPPSNAAPDLSNASACNGTSAVLHLPWDIFARPDCCNFQSWNIVVISCLLCVRGMSSISAGPTYRTCFRGFTQSHGRFLPRHHWHPFYWSTCHSCCQGAPVVIVWYCYFVVCAFVFTSVGTKSWRLPLRPRDAWVTGPWCLFVWCSEESVYMKADESYVKWNIVICRPLPRRLKLQNVKWRGGHWLKRETGRGGMVVVYFVIWSWQRPDRTE